MDESEVKEQLFNALKIVANHPDFGNEWLIQNLPALVKGYRSADYFYKPDQALLKRIEQYKEWYKTKKGENPGQLMEEIAFLSFRCLRGWSDLKSYQSYAAQHDLVISGADIDWIGFILYLNPKWQSRTIVIEAKNYSSKIDDPIVSRMCNILTNVFDDSSNLGVFFTIKGATGFPEDPTITSKRKRILRDSQATQIIFHAKTGKCVIVLTHKDILSLIEPGALPRILEAKIRAIEEFTGLPVSFDGQWQEIDLPEHLRKHNL